MKLFPIVSLVIRLQPDKEVLICNYRFSKINANNKNLIYKNCQPINKFDLVWTWDFHNYPDQVGYTKEVSFFLQERNRLPY